LINFWIHSDRTRMVVQLFQRQYWLQSWLAFQFLLPVA